MIRPGDQLRCITPDGHFLAKGRVYTVSEVFGDLVGLQGVIWGHLWGLWRFQRVPR